MQVEWSKDGVVVVQTTNCTISTEVKDSVYVTSLTLRQVAANDAGKYQVIISNQYGQVDMAVSLIVKGLERS